MVGCISIRLKIMFFRPLPILTIATVASLVILIVLGNWQWEKFSKKSDQVSTVAENVVEGIAVVVESPKGGDAVQVYGLIEGNSVWRRYVPGRINGVGDPVLVLYDATVGPDQVPLQVFGLGTLRIAGASNVFVRKDSRGFFTPRNDPQKNTWYWFDGTKMIERYGYPATATVKVVEREFITVRGSVNLQDQLVVKNPYYTPVTQDTLPRERHLGYALSWWGMAIALSIIYFAYHFRQGRLRVQ